MALKILSTLPDCRRQNIKVLDVTCVLNLHCIYRSRLGQKLLFFALSRKQGKVGLIVPLQADPDALRSFRPVLQRGSAICLDGFSALRAAHVCCK